VLVLYHYVVYAIFDSVEAGTFFVPLSKKTPK
jgi:hypothetical protein